MSAGIQVFFGTVAILETELTIRANSIRFSESIGSSGQLLPFVLGIFTLATTLVAIIHPDRGFIAQRKNC